MARLKLTLLNLLFFALALPCFAERTVMEGKPSTLNSIFVSSLTSRVGISSTTPSMTLDVGGDINFSGGLYHNGTPYATGTGTFVLKSGDTMSGPLIVSSNVVVASSITANYVMAAGANFTGPVTGISLSEIEDLTANKVFTMGNKTLEWQFVNPAGGMMWEFTGAAAGHSLEIAQTGGNPSTNMHLLHIHATDPDPTILHLVPGSVASRALLIHANGDTTTNPGRFELTGAGGMAWGTGGGATDTTLARTGVAALQTNAALTAASFVGPLTGNASSASTAASVPPSGVDLSTVTAALSGKLSNTASVPPSLVDLSTITVALASKLNSTTTIPSALVNLSTVTSALALKVNKTGDTMGYLDITAAADDDILSFGVMSNIRMPHGSLDLVYYSPSKHVFMGDGDINVLYISSSGVGVFTPSPTSPLDVTGLAKFQTIVSTSVCINGECSESWATPPIATLQSEMDSAQANLSSLNAAISTAVFTTGNQTISGVKTFSNQIGGSISGNANAAGSLIFTPNVCSAGYSPRGIDIYGHAVSCQEIGGGGDVFLASSQTFTGSNIFLNPTTINTATLGAVTWGQDIAASNRMLEISSVTALSDIAGNVTKGLTVRGFYGDGVAFRIPVAAPNVQMLVSAVTTQTSSATFKSNVGVTGNVTATGFLGQLTGNVIGDVSGNAGTVTNGVYSTGSYADPSWITSLSTSKINLSTVTSALDGKLSNTASIPQNLVNLSTVTTALAGKLSNTTTVPSNLISLSTVQPSGNYITSLTGAVTASGPGAAAATIVSVPASAVDLSTVTTALASKLSNATSVPQNLINLSTVTTALAGKLSSSASVPANLIDLSTVTTALSGKLSNTASVPTSLINLSTVTTALAAKLDRYATASAAVALSNEPAACSAGQYATDISSMGVLTCGTPTGAGDVLKASSQTFTGVNTFWNKTNFTGAATQSSSFTIKGTAATSTLLLQDVSPSKSASVLFDGTDLILRNDTGAADAGMRVITMDAGFEKYPITVEANGYVGINGGPLAQFDVNGASYFRDDVTVIGLSPSLVIQDMDGGSSGWALTDVSGELRVNKSGSPAISIAATGVVTMPAGVVTSTTSVYSVTASSIVVTPELCLNGTCMTAITASGGSGSPVYNINNFYANTNGSQTAFYLSSSPVSNSVILTKNGVAMVSPADYSIAGTTITMVTAPASSTTLVARYVTGFSTETVASITASNNNWTGTNSFAGTVALPTRDKITFGNELANSSSTLIGNSPTFTNTTFTGNTCISGSTLTITTNGGNVLIGFSGSLSNSSITGNNLSVKIDGAFLYTNAIGAASVTVPGANYYSMASFNVIKSGLSAGIHSFCLDASTGGGTGKLGGTSPGAIYSQFWVQELR